MKQSYFYGGKNAKIRSNPAYHPRKQTVLALAIALKLSIDDTVDLLVRAEYALSPGNKGDLSLQAQLRLQERKCREVTS